jgi:integrase/recombinase XerD
MAKANEGRCAVLRRTHANDLAPWVAEFTRYLSETGHTALTVKSYERLARPLAHWMVQTKVAVGDIDESVIRRFVRHRCCCFGNRHETHCSGKYARRVRRVVAFLSERRIVRQKVTSAVPVLERRVVQFQEWLRQHRGITERTIDQRGRMVMRLLPALGNRPRAWSARVVREVIMAEAKRASRAHVKSMATALRGYLRFLSANGFCRAGLEHAVPTIPEWRLSTLPRYIDAAQVERLVATCDLTTPIGLRDRAILLLLARLGLRAGDIVSLRLGDFDWQQATLSVRGKGRRETRLPLPQEAGDAVLAYLEQARPRVVGDWVFFLLNAPIRPLTSSGVVTSIVCSAIRKAGIDAPIKGAHLLRHSAATAMLRGGATLDMVGAVLRHRSPDMTAHYAKVDITMLQQIAQPWTMSQYQRIIAALLLMTSIEPAVAQDAVNGEDVFKKCRTCHQVGDGAKNSVGPILNGIVGRAAGTIDGFSYSPANKEAGSIGLVWSEENLFKYLENPAAFMPKTKMIFPG